MRFYFNFKMQSVDNVRNACWRGYLLTNIFVEFLRSRDLESVTM